jgi:hypothetical protein
MKIPAEILKADATLHALFERVAFSRHLNPTNIAEARQAFNEGAEAPPFAYLPVEWAQEVLETLERIRLSTDHPFGALVQASVDSTCTYIRALDTRTPEAFDALAREAGWYPDAHLVAAATREVRARDAEPFCLGASDLLEMLQNALQERGLDEWRVELDSVMSARVLVDSAKRLLRVNSRARFRERDMEKLVVHEIEVHAIRAANGAAQPLHIFATGLPGALETEEGLALLAEERAEAVAPGSAWRQGLVVRAIEWARTMGFRQLYDTVCEAGGQGLAWGVSLRLKRGLAHPGAPGVYAKDVVYYKGVGRVRAYLEAGHPVEHLYVGKVSIDHPVKEWLEEGLVAPMPVPQVFRDHIAARVG